MKRKYNSKSIDQIIFESKERCQLEDKIKKEILSNNPVGNLYGKKLAAYKEMIVRQVDGSMSIEGMSLSDEDKERIRNFAFDITQINSVVSSLVNKHSMVG